MVLITHLNNTNWHKINKATLLLSRKIMPIIWAIFKNVKKIKWMETDNLFHLLRKAFIKFKEINCVNEKNVVE